MTLSSSSSETALEARSRAGHRLSSPSAGRNKAVIASTLAGLLPRDARVLEAASGTGEHALACVEARPDLTWIPSELNKESRASVDAWAIDAGGRIQSCLALDMTRADWAEGLASVDAIFCANMIHIAPWEACEGLFAGASGLLSAGAKLHLYGPFREGDQTAPSNLDFDESLKRRDRRWGVRSLDDVNALAERHGFMREGRIEMPANNLLVSWVKTS